MDWNLKIPPWDFTELEQGTIPNIDSVNTSSNFGGQRFKGDFSVDLKLGQVIDSGNSKVTPGISKMALSPSGSSKRARAINNTIQAVAVCLVDGCNADLSNCREYHRRHKVCEVHSKTPQVSINGQKQRFCQQCSRFHSLEEFDEGKRSCRKRLDGHNRRRRKPQPDTLSRAASFFSSHQGTKMLQFSTPHLYPTTPLRNPLWTGNVKVEEDVKYYNQHTNLPQQQNTFSESSSSSSKVPRKLQFSLFQGSGLELNSHQTSLPPKVCQRPLGTFAPSETSSSNNQLFCDEYLPARVTHSDCALSLLSSSPSQTSCTTLGHVMLQPNSFSTTANPLDPAINFGGLEPMDSIMVPNVNENDSDVVCNGMIHTASHHHASHDNGAPQTLPFYWE